MEMSSSIEDIKEFCSEVKENVEVNDRHYTAPSTAFLIHWFHYFTVIYIVYITVIINYIYYWVIHYCSI